MVYGQIVRARGELEPDQLIIIPDDIGILISPTYGADARLTSSKSASKYVIEAAKSLASRFNEKVGCLRSWDVVQTCVYSYGPAESETDFRELSEIGSSTTGHTFP
jgi:hypothetical protein